MTPRLQAARADGSTAFGSTQSNCFGNNLRSEVTSATMGSYWRNSNCADAVLRAIIAGLAADKQKEPDLKDCPCNPLIVAGGGVPDIVDRLDETTDPSLPATLGDDLEDFKKAG